MYLSETNFFLKLEMDKKKVNFCGSFLIDTEFAYLDVLTKIYSINELTLRL